VVSSVVERLVYTEDVGGSKPSPPTRFIERLLKFQNTLFTSTNNGLVTILQNGMNLVVHLLAKLLKI
jgi:hypothetical protein